MTHDSAISGSHIQLVVVKQNNFPDVQIPMSIWILRPSFCPLVSFAMPRGNGVSLKLTSDTLKDSFCVFLDISYTYSYFFGVISNSSSARFELFSPNNEIPFAACYGSACKAEINEPFFFWYKSDDSVVQTEIFIQSDGYYDDNEKELKGEISQEIDPNPFYNETHENIVVDEFNVKTVNGVSKLFESRMVSVSIITKTTVGFMILLIVLKIILSVILIYQSYKASKIHLNSASLAPATLVLNQYCPNTSRKLIMTNFFFHSY